MVSLALLAHTSKLVERVKVAMGVRRNFSRGRNVDICLSFSGCWCYNAHGCLQNALLFLHHKENAPWKHALYSHLFWIFFRAELFRPTNLQQRCTFCHPLQSLLNWRIFTQLSLKWTWTINENVCGSLISLYWLNRTHFWNLLSELFSKLRLSEMLFHFMNVLISIFESTF